MAEIKLVAVDEDGTFMRDHVTYDVERFERIFACMQERGIRFVVATGNQCYQVQQFFPNHLDEIGIVSANGAYVLDGREPVFAAEAEEHARTNMIEACHAHPEVPFSMLGVNGSYCERNVSQEFFDDMHIYQPRLDWVDDFSDVDDQIFMFSSNVDESVVRQQIAYFQDIVGDTMDVVSSGAGYFDVVCPGVSKATGLKCLCDRWGILPEECIAFGDSDNDLAMLGFVGVGYAMQNAPENVRAAADRIAPPNTEDGVLQVLEELLDLG